MDKFSLLSGDDFTTSNGINIKHPKLNDIKYYGESKYMSFVNLFCLKPHELMVELWDSGIDFEDISQFELFLMLYSSSKEDCNELFASLMGLFDIQYGFKKDTQEQAIGARSIVDDDAYYIIDERVFNEISNYFQIIHCRDDGEKAPKFKNQSTKEMYIEMEKGLKSDRDKNDSVLTSAISALVWGNNGAVNWDNVWDLYVYQFYDGLKRISKIKHYDNTMNGIYHGTIDQKKVNMKEINWLSD